MNKALTRDQVLWRWRIFICTYVGYAGYYLTRKVYSICKSSLHEQFDWNSQQLAHIWTVYLIAYSVGQFINSYYGRRLGARAILLTGLAISIGCNVVFGAANSYQTFLVFMAVNGLVQATGWPGVVGTISRWIRPGERGTIMGIWGTSYQLGTILVGFIGGFLLGRLGWRWSFWGCTMITLGIWWLIFLWQRNKPEDAGLDPIVGVAETDTRAVRGSQADSITFKEYLQIALSPLVLLMGASYFCIKFVRYGLDSWLPMFLNILGMSKEFSSYYSQVFTTAGLLGAVATGFILDRFLKGRWALLSFIMGMGMVAGCLAVIVQGTSPMAIALYSGIIGFMIYGPDTMLCGFASIVLAGEKNTAAVAGVVNGIGSIGPVLAEEVGGWMIREGVDPQVGIQNTNMVYMFMSAVFVCLMAVAMIALRRTHATNAARDALETSGKAPG
jgi:sugar phosphate permease